MTEVDFHVARCPQCEEVITTEDMQPLLRLFVATGALLVHIATIEQLMAEEEYDNIRDAWEERRDAVVSGIMTAASEMQDFGEHYDHDGDDSGEE